MAALKGIKLDDDSETAGGSEPSDEFMRAIQAAKDAQKFTDESLEALTPQQHLEHGEFGPGFAFVEEN